MGRDVELAFDAGHKLRRIAQEGMAMAATGHKLVIAEGLSLSFPPPNTDFWVSELALDAEGNLETVKTSLAHMVIKNPFGVTDVEIAKDQQHSSFAFYPNMVWKGGLRVLSRVGFAWPRTGKGEEVYVQDNMEIFFHENGCVKLATLGNEQEFSTTSGERKKFALGTTIEFNEAGEVISAK